MSLILEYWLFLYDANIPKNQPVFLKFLFFEIDFEILKISLLYWIGNGMRSDIWKSI